MRGRNGVHGRKRRQVLIDFSDSENSSGSEEPEESRASELRSQQARRRSNAAPSSAPPSIARLQQRNSFYGSKNELPGAKAAAQPAAALPLELQLAAPAAPVHTGVALRRIDLTGAKAAKNCANVIWK